jgi:dihydroxyacetone kinase-like protein
MFTLSKAKKWLAAVSKVLEENKNYLTDLDSAIGDADHGTNICRGFAAAVSSVDRENPQSLPAFFKLISVALIKNTGGASGPLYGTFFLKLGLSLTGESASAAEFYNALTAGMKGIMELGHSKAGEKTMLDAIAPALEAARELADGTDFKAFAGALSAAAKNGADSTVPMLATKGRASYLGERSIGHMDPGAASSYLIFKALSEQPG